MPYTGEKMVAPTGFEPATSALRGRRPKPLDDGAIKKPSLNKDGFLLYDINGSVIQ